jgi:hypothetical protein
MYVAVVDNPLRLKYFHNYFHYHYYVFHQVDDYYFDPDVLLLLDVYLFEQKMNNIQHLNHLNFHLYHRITIVLLFDDELIYVFYFLDFSPLHYLVLNQILNLF